MRNRVVTLAAFLLIAACAIAQEQPAPETYTLSGQVVWKAGIVSLNSEAREMSGKPVADATVRMGPGNYTATTDENGMFTITGIKRGSYTLHVKAKEHSSKTKIALMNEDKWIDVSLVWRGLRLGGAKRNE